MNEKQLGKTIWYLLLAFSTLMLINKILLVFTYRFEIAGLEPYFSYLVLKVNSGQLFTNPEQFPFIVTQYSPLYFYVVNAFAEVLQWLGIHEVRAVYIVGRGINLMANLVTCLLVYRLFKRYLKLDKKWAFLVSMVVFNLFINHNIGVRTDSLKILFLSAMFIQLLIIIKAQSLSNWISFTVFAILALLCKQDALVPVLMALLILFSYKYYVKSIVFGAVVGLVSGLTILGLCNWKFEILTLNLLGGISQGMNLNWWLDIVRLNYLTFAVQLFFLIVGVKWLISKKYNFVWILSLVVIYVAAFMALFKWGSNFNYFIEFQIISAVLVLYITFASNTNHFKWLTLVCFAAIFFNNFQNKNVSIPNFWVERDAFYLFNEMKLNANKISEEVLKDKEAIICFDLKYPLFLNEKSIQWAMVNDYPEVFLPKLESLSSELPIQVFNYHYDCSNEKLVDAILMSPTKNAIWDAKKLNNVFKRTEETDLLQLQLYNEWDNYNFYEIKCP